MLWTIISESSRRLVKDSYARRYYFCRCLCGVEKFVRKSSYGVTSFSCKSCAKSSHGDSHTRFYSIWKNMMSRCHNPNSNTYINYGAIGISVCDRWKSYYNFREDMESSYLEHVELFGSENTSIDRRDNYKGYSKDNCRWATMKEQRFNRRGNNSGP